jgi:hypothetical protein
LGNKLQFEPLKIKNSSTTYICNAGSAGNLANFYFLKLPVTQVEHLLFGKLRQIKHILNNKNYFIYKQFLDWNCVVISYIFKKIFKSVQIFRI